MDATDDSKNVIKRESLLQLPAELIFRILSYCNIFDICSVSLTCKALHEHAESHYVWKQKWDSLSQKSKLQFPLHVLSTNECINYKILCIRLWKICFQKHALPRCIHCKQTTCSESCSQTWDRKVVIDIGSKITWLLPTSFVLRRHPSVVAIRKPREYSSQGENCACNCGHRFVNPACILCSPEKTDVVFVDWKMRQNCTCLEECVCQFIGNKAADNCQMYSCMKNLNLREQNSIGASERSSLWDDIMFYIFGNVSEWQMVSPLDCFFDQQIDLTIYHFYLKHILEQYKMLEEVRKPNVSLIICEPVQCTSQMRKKIASLLFEQLQVNRICFLNKALAVSKLIELETCLVVDSGANNTVVTVIIDGKVQHNCCKHVPVGGLSIAQQLAQAIEMNGLMDNIALSSLDTNRVKSSCHLAYSLAAEERRKTPTPKQSVHVRSRINSDGSRSKLHQVDLGAELHLAPETMYAAAGIPELIKNCVENLSEEISRDVLSKIILTGGNTELKGFANRLTKDLRQLLPKFSAIINTPTFSGCRSCDAVMGGSRVHTPLSSDWNEEGHAMWITKELFTLQGANCLL